MSDDKIKQLHNILDCLNIAKEDDILKRFGLLLQQDAYKTKDLVEAESSRHDLWLEVLDLLKNIGDMDYELKGDANRLFDKKFPWDAVNNVVHRSADIRFKYYGDVKTWDLTNDPARRSRILSALGRDEEGNKLPEPIIEYGTIDGELL